MSELVGDHQTVVDERLVARIEIVRAANGPLPTIAYRQALQPLVRVVDDVEVHVVAVAAQIGVVLGVGGDQLQLLLEEVVGRAGFPCIARTWCSSLLYAMSILPS